MHRTAHPVARRIGVVVAVASMTITALAGPVTADPATEHRGRTDFRDITNTDRGQQAAEKATRRWAANKDVYRNKDYVRVLEAGSAGDATTIVVPKYVKLIDAETTRTAAGVESTMGVDVSLAAAMGEVSSAGNSGWNHRASDCFAREENNTGWIDSCYKIHQYNTDSSDGSSTRDIFQLEHYATAKSKSNWALRSATLTSDQSSSSDPFRDWVDWDPGADQDVGSCTSITVGVAYSGVGISASHNICDKWNITKWSDVGHFRNSWEGWAWRSEREVAYMTAIKVDQGDWPTWSLWDSFWADP